MAYKKIKLTGDHGGESVVWLIESDEQHHHCEVCGDAGEDLSGFWIQLDDTADQPPGVAAQLLMNLCRGCVGMMARALGILK